MSDWSLPISTTLYTGVLTALDDRLDELAKMFNGTSATNLPTGAFRIDGTSNNLLQTWGGASWDNEKLSVQTLLVGADGVNAEATVTDLFFGAGANISAEGNLNLFIDSDNNATDRQFRWYKNAAGVTGAALLMSLTEAGVLAVPGSISEGGTSLSAKYMAPINTYTALAAGLAGTDELLVSDAGVLKRMDVSVMNAYFNSNLSFNNYSHPNHTGHVSSSGDGATTLLVAAITGQTNTDTLAGTDEFLVSDGGAIRRVDMNRFIVGQTLALSSGLADTDELLVSDAGTIKRMDVSVLREICNPLLQTETLTTSGTEHDYTSIPSWVKKITVMYSGLSTNGSSKVIVQIGDSGGFETSNYLGSSGDSGSDFNISAGFRLHNNHAGGYITHGMMTIVRLGGNTWVATANTSRSDNTIAAYSAGSKDLSGALDRLRLTTEGGSNTFDAGSFNIMWE